MTLMDTFTFIHHVCNDHSHDDDDDDFNDDDDTNHNDPYDSFYPQADAWRG